MHELSIRKVPGVGRVHERLLDAIGIKVRLEAGRCVFLTGYHDFLLL